MWYSSLMLWTYHKPYQILRGDTERVAPSPMRWSTNYTWWKRIVGNGALLHVSQTLYNIDCFYQAINFSKVSNCTTTIHFCYVLVWWIAAAAATTTQSDSILILRLNITYRSVTLYYPYYLSSIVVFFFCRSNVTLCQFRSLHWRNSFILNYKNVATECAAASCRPLYNNHCTDGRLFACSFITCDYARSIYLIFSYSSGRHDILHSLIS